MPFSIALCQAAPRVGDKEHNLDRIGSIVADVDADLAVFPELFVPGYLARDDHRQLAEPISGPSVARLSSLASEHDTQIVTGIGLEDPDVRGLVYNAALHVGPGQEASAHRKTLLPTFGPFEEDFYFGEGRDLEVVETPIGTIGLTVCYELFFPEVTKSLAMQGADLIVNISASPTLSKRYFEALLPARAIETTCFTAFANLVGQQDHLTFWGGSRLVGPRGNLVRRAEYFEEEVVTAEIDLRELPSTRDLRPVLRDSEPGRDRPPRELVELEKIQGDVTPWGVVGFRMGLLGRELADLPGRSMSCTVRLPDAAREMLDGLQVASGCTLGNGNLSVEDGDAVEAVFEGSRESTIRLQPDVDERIAGGEDAPEVARAIADMDVKELFEVA